VFDIGFAELLLIGVIGLLVVGPEQLPGAVRTVLAWVNRFRRSFDQIRTEVRRELHNDEIMQKLKAESRELQQQVRDTTQSVEHELQALGADASASLHPPWPPRTLSRRPQRHHRLPGLPTLTLMRALRVQMYLKHPLNTHD
jgi:sec-independent protein translocase protein TatB